MSDNMSTPSSFSVALHQAISNSGLSLAQIVSQLSGRGLKISRTTLSQWQTGISIPRRTSSRVLIGELENILALPPQSLTSLLPRNDTSPLPRLRSTSSKNIRNAPVTISSFNTAATEEHFRSIEKLTDLSREVTREAIEEHITVSADFCTITQNLSTLVRIPNTDKPTMHTKTWWTKEDALPEEDDIGIYDIKGAFPSSTEVSIFEDGLVKVTCLEFPSYITPGGLHNVSYTLRLHYAAPITETTQRLISSKLRYYSCAVTFEGEAPDSLHWIFSHADSERSDVSHITEAREMRPYNKSVQVTLEDVEHATCLFRWA